MYNGHKNWNHWNVSLWLNNEEPLYRLMVTMVEQYNREEAVEKLLEELHSQGIYKTPDGAPYSKSAIRKAMVGI